MSSVSILENNGLYETIAYGVETCRIQYFQESSSFENKGSHAYDEALSQPDLFPATPLQKHQKNVPPNNLLAMFSREAIKKTPRQRQYLVSVAFFARGRQHGSVRVAAGRDSL